MVFFRTGTDDSEKIPVLRESSAYCRAIRPQESAAPLQRLVGASCPVVARRAKPEADRLFSFADLRIGKRKLGVPGDLSEAGGSSFSLVPTGAWLKRPFSYENYPLNR